MAKEKKIFVCSECGFETPRWGGKCPQCDACNTLEEKIETKVEEKQPEPQEKPKKKAYDETNKPSITVEKYINTIDGLSNTVPNASGSTKPDQTLKNKAKPKTTEQGGGYKKPESKANKPDKKGEFKRGELE